MQRRELFALAALPALPLFAAEGGRIPNGVVRKEDVRATPENGAGESVSYYEGRTDQLKDLSVGTWRVRPGKSPHDIHSHPEEELLVFAEGTGEVSIEGKRSKVAPGSIMYCAGSLPHGVYNTGPGDMLFYFIKWRA